MSKVSVIVPVYNVECYIRDCIDSILSQTFIDFELILVDDGSLDRSGEICDEYAKKDRRIRVFHKENGGVSCARNLGIEHATGEWLCFIDSDDIIEPTYLEDFAVCGNYDIVMQGYKVMVNDTVTARYNFKQCDSKCFDYIIGYAEKNNILNSPCFKLYRADIVKEHKILFETKTSFGEDHLFTLNYLQNVDSAFFSEKEGYIYRYSGNESLTNRALPLSELDFYTRKTKEYHELLDKKFNNQAIHEIFMWRYYDNLIRLIRTSINASIGPSKFGDYIKAHRGSIDIPRQYFSYCSRFVLFVILKSTPFFAYCIAYLFYKIIKNE